MLFLVNFSLVFLLCKLNIVLSVNFIQQINNITNILKVFTNYGNSKNPLTSNKHINNLNLNCHIHFLTDVPNQDYLKSFVWPESNNRSITIQYKNPKNKTNIKFPSIKINSLKIHHNTFSCLFGVVVLKDIKYNSIYQCNVLDILDILIVDDHHWKLNGHVALINRITIIQVIGQILKYYRPLDPLPLYRDPKDNLIRYSCLKLGLFYSRFRQTLVFGSYFLLLKTNLKTYFVNSHQINFNGEDWLFPVNNNLDYFSIKQNILRANNDVKQFINFRKSLKIVLVIKSNNDLGDLCFKNDKKIYSFPESFVKSLYCQQNYTIFMERTGAYCKQCIKIFSEISYSSSDDPNL